MSPLNFLHEHKDRLSSFTFRQRYCWQSILQVFCLVLTLITQFFVVSWFNPQMVTLPFWVPLWLELGYISGIVVHAWMKRDFSDILTSFVPLINLRPDPILINFPWCRSWFGGSRMWFLRSFHMPLQKMPYHTCLLMSTDRCNMHRVWACGMGARRSFISLLFLWHVVVWGWPVRASSILSAARHRDLPLSFM